MKTRAEKFDEAAAQTSGAAAALLLSLPQDIRASAYEIRLRCSMPPALTLPTGIYVPDRDCRITRQTLADTFIKMCGSAIYSRQNEIASGCITLQGGHRVGICGRAVIENGRVINVTDISSLCVRIAHEEVGCAEKIARLAEDGGLLIAGPPCSGKTTLLRDLALTISSGRNVALIDEKGELAAMHHGVPQLTTGCFCDVVTGFSKADGMLHAVRCLSPQVMICDEISSAEEAHAVSAAFNSGVTCAVSMHCGSADELEKRTQYEILKETGALRRAVLLEPGAPGRIGAVIEL